MPRRDGGVVVNADSMQVYRELRILRRGRRADDEAAAPHRLYGHVPAAERYSVGRWLDDVAPVLAEARERGRLPIVVGGTGLYFKALTEGLAAVPPIPAEVRERVRGGGEGLGERRSARAPRRDRPGGCRADPAVGPGADRPRARGVRGDRPVARRAGARPSRCRRSLDPAAAERIVLDPTGRCCTSASRARAERMIHAGALAEVGRSAGSASTRDLPAMKAIGVRELLDHIAGKTSLDEALAADQDRDPPLRQAADDLVPHQMADWARV